MKILHTADWHLGELNGPVIDGQNARLLDTVRCVDFLVETAEKEQPDVILIAGDLFHKSQMWASPMLNLIDIAVSRLRKLAAIAPTVLMFGTANHDSLDAFKNIDSMNIPNLYVITTPGIFTLQTKSGPLQIAAVPGLDKGHFRAQNPGMDPIEENAICSKLLGDLVLGLGAQIDQSILPVLMSHYTVAGCEYDNGQMSIFNNAEVILPREALAVSPFDLVCLGHIHRMQEVRDCGRPVFYSGPLNGLTFNEEGQQKGFWMHEIDTDLPYDNINSRFIETPSRWFTTIKVMKDERYDWPKLFADDPREAIDIYAREIDPCKDAITRFHYICDEETRKRINHKAIEKALYDAGAFYVSEIKPLQINAVLSKQEMSENAGPLDNLRAWCKAEGLTSEETLAIEILASPLIETVSARMPTGKLSGIFVPRRLEVKNYRSYKDETFDFSPVSFATVNGPNGVGKSALFMDAICDCLYEEPREGELTGWISNDEAARSGSITFEFSMGDTTWRVIRTRAKSGKVTLSLQQWVDDKWADRGDTKKDDTQQKIINLLGMDAMTFRCCGLIMQDAYGIFLEADRADRMEVLGNILGLGVYEQLEKLAKDKVTETNRLLTAAKDKLADLNEKLKVKPETEQRLIEAEKAIKSLTDDITNKESALREAEEYLQQLQIKKSRADNIQKQFNKIADEVKNLRDEQVNQQSKITKHQQKIDAEQKILEKSAEYEQLKQQVTVLQTKRPRLTELSNEENTVSNEISRVDAQIRRLVPQIREIDGLLKNKAALELAAAQCNQAIKDDERFNELSEQYRAFTEQVMELEKITDPLIEQIETEKRYLKTLKEKAEMLSNSGCINPEEAQCRFLADAQECKKQIPDQMRLIKDKESKRDELIQQIKVINEQQKSLGYDKSIHWSVRQIIKELRPKAEQAAQLSAKAELLESLNSQKRQAEEHKQQLTERLESVKEWARKLSEELEALAAMELRLTKLEVWAKAKEDLPAAKQVVATATEEIRKHEEKISALKQEAKDLNEEQKLILVEVAGIKPTISNVSNLRDYIKELQDKLNVKHSEAGGLRAKLDALKNDEEERWQVVAEMEPLAAMLTRYQTLARAFGQDGIPFSIVRSVVPELSAQANEILGQMTGGKMSLEMKTERIQKSNKKEINALEIWITDYQRGSLPYKSRSGGQKVKAALSVAFALADLKARRAGIQLGMMFVDEPPFLDGEGTEAYCDALEVMSQRYQGMKVIAISHDPRMKSRFPQQINVEDRGNEGSKLVLVA